jgi:hypothetical protein
VKTIAEHATDLFSRKGILDFPPYSVFKLDKCSFGSSLLHCGDDGRNNRGLLDFVAGFGLRFDVTVDEGLQEAVSGRSRA